MAMSDRMKPLESGVIERAAQLLKLLATAGRRGMALSEIAKSSALANSTVHRLLQQLIQERLVMQPEAGRRYALGPLAFELGLAAAASFDLRHYCRIGMQQLAEKLGDTVYLSVRSGFESVCQDRVEGPSPIRVNTLEIGSRRPLGMGAGGLAILSYLPAEEFDDVMSHIGPLVEQTTGLSSADLQASVETTRRQGYSFIRNRVTLGVTAIGVPVFDSLDRPIAAISIAAIDERMRPERIAALASSLRQQSLLMRQAILGSHMRPLPPSLMNPSA